jgi:hypothetical protein
VFCPSIQNLNRGQQFLISLLLNLLLSFSTSAQIVQNLPKSNSKGLEKTGDTVRPDICSGCTYSFGVAQFLQEFDGLAETTISKLYGARTQAGDTLVIGYGGYNKSGATAYKVTDTCGNTFKALTPLAVNSAPGNRMQLFYAWNTTPCSSDEITITHAASSYSTVVSWDVRYADTASDPFDVGAAGLSTNSAVTSEKFSTHSDNEIAIALAWSNNQTYCSDLLTGNIGEFTASPDSTNTPMSLGMCPYYVAEHAVLPQKQTDITASAVWHGPLSGGIVVAVFRRITALPTQSLHAKFDARIATGATWSKNSDIVTVADTDPQPAATDVGKVIFGTTSSNGSDGFQAGGLVVIPQGVIKAVDGRQIKVSRNATAANQNPNLDGFTGYVVWCTNDTDALRAAWKSTLQSNGGTLVLPQGAACFDGPLFTNTSGNLYNKSILGASGGGTVLIPLPEFQYDNREAEAKGLVYYDNGCDLIGTGESQTQKATNPCELRDWNIWGATQSGMNVHYHDRNHAPAPPIYAVRATLINVSCGSWNNAFGGRTDSSWPGIVLVGSTAINASNLACGNAGLSLEVAPVTQAASNVYGGIYGWTWGAGLVISKNTGVLAHQSFGAQYATPDYPDHTMSVENCNLALCQTGGNLVSHGDIYYGSILSVSGSTFLIGTVAAKVNTNTEFLNIRGASVSANASVIPSFNMTSGAFYDLGFNPKAFGGPSWTTGKVLITGGSVNGSASVTGSQQIASNWNLKSGSGPGEWGISPSVECPGSLFPQAGDSHKQSCTIHVGKAKVGVNPVVVLKFPTPFATAPTCDARITSGTSGYAYINVGVPSSTGVVFTYQGTPVPDSTIGLVVTCGP